MKTLINIFLITLISLFIVQPNVVLNQKKIDSLLAVLQTGKEDTNKVILLNNLCWEYGNIGGYDTAINYGNTAFQLAQQLNFKRGIATSYNNIGCIYLYQGNYPDALKNIFIALKIREEIGDKSGLASSYNNIGIISQDQGNYPDALKNNFLALKIYKELGQKLDIASSYNNIGTIYNNQGNYPEALNFFLIALKIRKEIGDKKGIADTYNNIGIIYDNQSNYPEALKNYFYALVIYEKSGDKLRIASSYNNIGCTYKNQGNYIEALKYSFLALKIREKIGGKQDIASSYNNIGCIYDNQGNYPEALKSYLSALKINEEIGNKVLVSSNYANIGGVYYSQGNYPEALKNYFSSFKIKKEIGDKKGIADSYTNFGCINDRQGNYPEALKNYFSSLKILEEIGDKSGIADSYNNIGLVYYNQAINPNIHPLECDSLLNKAMKNVSHSLKIKEEIGDKSGIATSYNSIGTVLTKLHKHSQARGYLNKGLRLSVEIGYIEYIKDSYSALATLDSATGNYKGAYMNYKMYVLYRDSLDNADAQKKTIQHQMTYEFEKKEAVAKVEQEKKDAVAMAKSRKQQIIIWSVVTGFLLVIVFAGLIFRSLRITRRQKSIIEKQKHLVDEKNSQLNQQNEEIRTQRDEIETQRDEITAQRDTVTLQKNQIEKIHLEVSQSIDYATRIQTSILPAPEFLNKYLSDHFVLFHPKDKVSGDFYWWAVVEKHLIITVADCTGHGVPGAFMSMLGTSFLREIVVKEYMTNPSIILKRLRKEIIHALKQSIEHSEQKDGMDMALIVINCESLEMQFAGANNPIYLIKRETENNETSLLELKPDKMPVAIYDKMNPFTNQEIKLQKGDIIYLMSDGYEDQFGGEKNKKFMSKRMKELFVNIHIKPMIEQKEILNNTIKDWMNDQEQVDDITVMGIKI